MGMHSRISGALISLGINPGIKTLVFKLVWVFADLENIENCMFVVFLSAQNATISMQDSVFCRIWDVFLENQKKLKNKPRLIPSE